MELSSTYLLNKTQFSLYNPMPTQSHPKHTYPTFTAKLNSNNNTRVIKKQFPQFYPKFGFFHFCFGNIALLDFEYVDFMK